MIARHYGRHATICVDIREIQLPAQLQQIESRTQHLLFICRKVHNAIGDNNIKGGQIELQICQEFNGSFMKLNIRFCIAISVAMMVLVGTRHIELFIGHIDPHNKPLLAKHLW